MGKQRERNRIKSRIDELPPEARVYLDAALADVTNTYEQIAASMSAQGWEIGKSSVGRYALRSNAVAQRLMEAREQTTALLNVARNNQDIDASELATSLLIDGLTRRIAVAEEEFDSLPLDKAGKLIVQLQRSAVYKERMKSTRSRACQDVEANIIRRIREQIQDDTDLLKRLEQIIAAAAKEEAQREDC